MNLIHVNGMSMPRKKGKWQISHTQLKYLLAMKLFVLILILSANVSANVYSQKIDLSVSNGSLRAVMQDLRKQTGYNFFFKSEILKNAKPVNMRLKQASLEEALEAIFKDQPFHYEIKDNGVLIKVKEKPSQNLLDKVKDIIKAISITGKVTDESGSPLPGVSVVVKDSKVGTVTDTEGAFKLDANTGDVLTFSFIGYRTEEVPVQDQTVLNVVLRQLTAQLDQVQVIGYGITTQRLATGNVSVVRSDVISNQPVTNPLQALAGRVAGLQVTQGSGLPGREFYVQIRGRNSIIASNNPLYIVDGVPFPADQVGNASASPLNNISPDDIEAVSVLKVCCFRFLGISGSRLCSAKDSMESLALSCQEES